MLENLWWKDLGTTCLGWIESDPSVLDFTSNNKIAGHTRKKGTFWHYIYSELSRLFGITSRLMGPLTPSTTPDWE